MEDNFFNLLLADWQLNFTNQYLAERKQRSVLNAPVGSGKTVMALAVAEKMLEMKFSDIVLILCDLKSLMYQWQDAASKYINGKFILEFDNILEEKNNNSIKGIIVNLRNFKKLLELNFFKEGRLFVIVDEMHRHENNKEFNNSIASLITSNSENRILYLTQTPVSNIEIDKEYKIHRDVIFQGSLFELPKTNLEIVKFAPSLSILEKIIKGKAKIDNLNWREFEKFISQLLEKDGYTVELMRGTKDGGVDVIASKNLGIAGNFKTLWQAKKKLLKNKVGLSVIRELADTRNEFKASKGLIVTSTYLTRDALARIERDKYILGKVDKDDLQDWINRIMLNEV